LRRIKKKEKRKKETSSLLNLLSFYKKMKKQGALIAAAATPPGRGGIGIIRLSGANLANAAKALLSGGLPPPRRATRAAFYGANGALIDDGVALYFPAPDSFTGEDVLELHGHGSPAALRLLLRRALEAGARAAAPGEFSLRAYQNGKMDLAQAEGVADLINAETEAAARAGAQTAGGAFSRRAIAAADSLLQIRAEAEAGLDFPDEELVLAADDSLAKRCAAIAADLDALIGDARAGALLRDGFSAAIVGKPNAGKSTLLNELAGEELAIVTAQAGTTRDVVRETISINGVAARFADTAGLRNKPADAIEKEGVARAHAAAQRADVLLLICDAADKSPPPPVKVAPGAALIRVRNKIDLLGEAPAANGDVVCISAKTGAGIPLLKKTILQKMGYGESGTHDGDFSSSFYSAPFIARERHIQALRRARRFLQDACSHFAPPAAVELAAEALRLSHDALAEITGAATPDDVLGEIFSRFCIGK
jgi:tRNA modification GTPase